MHPEPVSASTSAAAAEPHFWAALAPPDQAALIAGGTTRRFARGQPLMHQGQLPDAVMLLRDGRVKVYTTTPTGREVLLAIRGPGELLGDLAALDARPRSASVVALEDGAAIVLSTEAFRAFLATHPAAAMAMLAMLSGRLRDADGKRIGFASLDAQPGRRAAARAGRPLRDRGRELRPDRAGLLQEELAGWSGSSLESVGRALATMRQLGWIETAGARSGSSISRRCGARPPEHRPRAPASQEPDLIDLARRR